MNGTVKTLKKEKGYGFIKGEDGKEYFFHVSGMITRSDYDKLQEDDPVNFEIEPNSTRGLRAHKIWAEEREATG